MFRRTVRRGAARQAFDQRIVGRRHEVGDGQAPGAATRAGIGHAMQGRPEAVVRPAHQDIADVDHKSLLDLRRLVPFAVEVARFEPAIADQ
jgi:hypothetical protein